MRFTIAVIGPGVDASASETTAAYEVGALLGKGQHTVVTGGLGGVMEAAARGAQAAGGLTVGLLPGVDRSNANPYLTVSLPTGIGEMRNALIVRAADAVICVGGSWGTLNEVAFAMRTAVPVVAIGGWRVTGAETQDAESPEAAVALALAAASRRGTAEP